MAKITNKLTVKSVDATKSRGRLSDGGGLYLNVTSNGRKAWVFRWKPRGGKVREMGLGPYPAISLAKARDEAADFRRMIAEGVDPKAERNKEVEPTFKECVEKFLDDMESQWSNEKHKYQWRQTLGPSYCAKIENKRVSEIAMDDVLMVLKPVWVEKPETASRLRGRIERVLNFAKVKGWRDGENPAAWRGNLQNVLPKSKKLTQGHLAAMPYHQVPEFVERLRTYQAMAARALEFAILTCGRSGEVLGARWDEIDFANQTWTIPAERMKARKEHVVPLSGAAMDILSPLSGVRSCEFVFPGQKEGKALSNMALSMLLRRMKVQDATPHGFRSSFRDWCGDETSFPREVAEGCLAHIVGNTVEQAYRRSTAIEKRRSLLEAWADYCAGDTGSNVVKLYV